MLGPIFLHWGGAYATYRNFFSKFRSSLGFDLPVEKLTFGTDEELALLNAVKTTLPGANNILYARHLQMPTEIFQNSKFLTLIYFIFFMRIDC